MQIFPPSDPALEAVGTISGVSFAIAAVTIFVVLTYSAYLLFRTKLSGRVEVFFGVLLFSLFFMWSLFMGGYLELTLGPLGTLLEVIAWSVSAAMFLIGHIRMLRQFNNASKRSP
jgi:hypothetical protein